MLCEREEPEEVGYCIPVYKDINVWVSYPAPLSLSPLLPTKFPPPSPNNLSFPLDHATAQSWRREGEVIQFSNLYSEEVVGHRAPLKVWGTKNKTRATIGAWKWNFPDFLEMTDHQTG